MSALHHLLRRSAGAMALVLAFAVLLGSLCPRGWFVCVHDEAFVLVDGHHANADDAACGEHGCPADGCPAAPPAPADDHDGCLDLALSFVFDDQSVALPVREELPSGPVLSCLPDLSAAAFAVCVPSRELTGGPPPSRFIAHIRLLV